MDKAGLVTSSMKWWLLFKQNEAQQYLQLKAGREGLHGHYEEKIPVLSPPVFSLQHQSQLLLIY